MNNHLGSTRLTECPQLINNKVHRHRHQNGNGAGVIQLGAQPGGVVENVRRQGNWRGGVHKQRGNHQAHQKRQDTRGKEGNISPMGLPVILTSSFLTLTQMAV